MRGALEDNLHVATDILQDGEAKDSDKIRALNFLARFSALDQEGIQVDAELLNKFFNVIERYITDLDALADIRESWLDICADRVGA